MAFVGQDGRIYFTDMLNYNIVSIGDMSGAGRETFYTGMYVPGHLAVR